MEKCYVIDGRLMGYDDAEYIREATDEEIAESDEAARHDGGAGVILVDVE